MNIDKAIEILKDHHELTLVYKNPDLKAAIELGIGALQQIAQMRLLDISPIAELLPGETED